MYKRGLDDFIAHSNTEIEQTELALVPAINGPPPSGQRPSDLDLLMNRLDDIETTSSVTRIWDWHSTIIVGLFGLIVWHFWSFRRFYLAMIRFEMRAAVHELGPARLGLSLTMQNDLQTVVYTEALTQDVPQPEIELVEERNVAIDIDDHFHDCQE